MGLGRDFEPLNHLPADWVPPMPARTAGGGYPLAYCGAAALALAGAFALLAPRRPRP